MDKNKYYKKENMFKHYEVPAALNPDTGELRVINPRPNNLPEGKEIWNTSGKFAKLYDKAWNYMLEVFSPLEFKIVAQMISMASINSNSLKPLNDNTTINELASTFNIHRNSVTKLFTKLSNHGIYAEFNFHKAPNSFDPNDPSTFNTPSIECKYWVLNPYIIFRGKTIDSALVDLFRDSKLSKYVDNVNYI
jgi:hypothetical protein